MNSVDQLSLLIPEASLIRYAMLTVHDVAPFGGGEVLEYRINKKPSNRHTLLDIRHGLPC